MKQKSHAKPPASLNVRMLGRLFGLFKGHWGAVLLGLALLLGSTGLALLPPWLVRFSVDKLVLGGASEQLLLVFVAIIVAVLVKGVLYYAERLLLESTGQQIVHDLRTRTLTHLNRLGFAFFDRAEVGDLVSRTTSDIDILTSFYGMGLVNIVNNLLTILGVLAVLFLWEPLLALGFLAFIPFILHAMLTYAVRVRPVMQQIRKQFGNLTSHVQQSLTGIETIKSLGTTEYEQRGFADRAGNMLEKNLAATKVSAFWLPYVNFLLGLGTAISLLWGGWLAINGTVTTGMLLGALTYIGMLLRPIRQTGMLLGAVMNATAAAERVFEILDNEGEDLDSGEWPGCLTGEISFHQVSFSYDDGKQVLSDINLKMEAGQTIAVVGPSGAGKTTIVSLIPGFYRPQSGSVMIDGLDVQKINLKRLRSHIGYLSQRPFLFDGTIRDNVTFGRPDADASTIASSIKSAVLSDFVASLPQGLQTEIGEKGVRLSGGQKQRLAIARVLITDPQIIILDEPTANLDRETEESINAALSEVMKGRTVVVIAHRLWTIQNADLVVFLVNGKISAVGKHTELLATEPAYREFVASQLSSQGGAAN